MFQASFQAYNLNVIKKKKIIYMQINEKKYCELSSALTAVASAKALSTEFSDK